MSYKSVTLQVKVADALRLLSRIRSTTLSDALKELINATEEVECGEIEELE